jgi:hypothetical protein
MATAALAFGGLISSVSLPLFSHEDKSKSQVVTIINTHETVE